MKGVFTLYGVEQDLEDVQVVDVKELKNIVLTIDDKVVGYIEVDTPYPLPDHETKGTYLHYNFSGHAIVEDDGDVYRHISNFSGGTAITKVS